MARLEVLCPALAFLFLGLGCGVPMASGTSLPSGGAGTLPAGGGGDAGTPDTGPLDGGDGGTTVTGSPDLGTYDGVVLADGPIAFLDLAHLSGTEPDLSQNDHTGTYKGGTPASATLPNGDAAADFNGSSEYLSVPSDAALSIPTTGSLTFEAWIRPDVLQFPNSNSGYVAWMGKCKSYAPTCEWEARMYSTVNPANRCNRLSAYAYNPGAGLGSGAFWQPACGLLQAGAWYHVVGEFTTQLEPASCPNAGTYPGSIDIWVNGVEWDQAVHNPTGCMSQYSVVPVAGDSPVLIGTMALDSFFAGAIGKVAIYDHVLSASQIAHHYQAMTGQGPSGSCADTCSLP